MTIHGIPIAGGLICGGVLSYFLLADPSEERVETPRVDPAASAPGGSGVPTGTRPKSKSQNDPDFAGGTGFEKLDTLWEADFDKLVDWVSGGAGAESTPQSDEQFQADPGRKAALLILGARHSNAVLGDLRVDPDRYSQEEREWIFRGIALADPEEAISKGRQFLKDADLERWFELQSMAIATLASDSPEAAFDFFRESGEHVRDAVASHLFFELTRSAPEEALAALDSIPEAPTFAFAAAGIISAFVEMPFDEVLPYLPWLTESEFASPAYLQDFYQLSIKDSSDADEMIAVISDPDHRIAIRKIALGIQKKEKGEAFLDEVRLNLENGDYGSESAAVATWAMLQVPADDLDLASAFVALLPESERVGALPEIKAFIRQSARAADLEQLEQWIWDHGGEGTFHHQVLGEYFRNVPGGDLVDVWARSKSASPDSPTWRMAYQVLWPRLQAEGKLTANEVSASVREGLTYIPDSALQVAFSESADLPRELLETGGTSGEQSERVLNVWTAASPQNALTWVGESLEAEERANWQRSVFESWLDNDLLGASDWLDGVSDPAKDGWIGLLVKRLAVAEPESALAWANSVQSAQLREKLRQMIDSQSRNPE